MQSLTGEIFDKLNNYRFWRIAETLQFSILDYLSLLTKLLNCIVWLSLPVRLVLEDYPSGIHKNVSYCHKWNFDLHTATNYTIELGTEVSHSGIHKNRSCCQNGNINLHTSIGQ